MKPPARARMRTVKEAGTGGSSSFKRVSGKRVSGKRVSGGRVLGSFRSFALPLVATLTMSVSYVDRQTMAVLAPQVTASLGIDNTHYGLLVSAFAVAYLVFTPLSGTVADR